jgi:hypothetical protein
MNVEMLLQSALDYICWRWVENVISESAKFFNLNALSPPK